MILIQVYVQIYLKLMVDGITSRPFSALTMPPFVIEDGAEVAQKIIESSRGLYTRPREVVEREIADWSGMMVGAGDGSHASSTPNSSGQGGGSSGSFNAEGKFKTVCSICGKEAIVPFEPAPGRPVYCKDCIAKIKSGELQPLKNAPRSRASEEKSFAPLASLGIEFASAGQSATEATARPKVVVEGPAKVVVSAPLPVHIHAPVTSQQTSRPTPTPFVHPKRKGPDILGLKSVLEEALSDTTSVKSTGFPQKHVQSFKDGTTAAKAEVEIVPAKEPAMSLSNLKKGVASTTTVLSTKDASTERVSALKDVIAQALRSDEAKSHEPSEQELAEKKKVEEVRELREQKLKLEALEKESERVRAGVEDALRAKQMQEAKEKAEAQVAAQKMRDEEAQRQKAEAEMKRMEEENKEKLLTAKRDAEALQAQKEKEEAESRAQKELKDDSEKLKSKKPKEVPQDVLNDILKI